MQAQPIDPRDTDVEITAPTYRVSFWKRQGDQLDAGFACKEYEVTDARDVDEVLEWARPNAGDGRTFNAYVMVEQTLLQVSGQDPTVAPPS
jgi:hypothetical protein